jgi:hypothetical protein
MVPWAVIHLTAEGAGRSQWDLASGKVMSFLMQVGFVGILRKKGAPLITMAVISQLETIV